MKKVFGNPIIVFLFLMIFPPLGIFFMFQFTDWGLGWKMSFAVVFAIIWIGAIIWAIQQEAQIAAQNMCILFNMM